MSKHKRVVWVVIHCEFMPAPHDPDSRPIIDEMVFHVSGSFRAAGLYVKSRTEMAPYGWWKVERRVVDEEDFEADDQPEVRYFNSRGQSRKKAPQVAALRAYDKWQEEEARDNP